MYEEDEEARQINWKNGREASNRFLDLTLE